MDRCSDTGPSCVNPETCSQLFFMSKIGTFDVNHYFGTTFYMWYPKKMVKIWVLYSEQLLWIVLASAYRTMPLHNFFSPFPCIPVHIKNGNSVPMRPDSISTMGTAFPRIPPRNDLCSVAALPLLPWRQLSIFLPWKLKCLVGWQMTQESNSGCQIAKSGI